MSFFCSDGSRMSPPCLQDPRLVLPPPAPISTPSPMDTSPSPSSSVLGADFMLAPREHSPREHSPRTPLLPICCVSCTHSVGFASPQCSIVSSLPLPLPSPGGLLPPPPPHEGLLVHHPALLPHAFAVHPPSHHLPLPLLPLSPASSEGGGIKVRICCGCLVDFKGGYFP
eukprot:GHVL01008039.1.p1 GENE.GHVL01008039.1~~GHVL01008039.1.p1  ORF type:complete len:170 (-),score=21.42 GHVL01008039.1:52-561(-)